MTAVLLTLLASLVCLLAGCGKGDAEKTEPATSTSAVASGGLPAFTGVPPEHIDQIVRLFNEGMGLMDQFRPLEAVEAFEEVVRLSPDWTTGRLNLGIALLNAQSDEAYARAEEELKKVIAADPANPYAHYALGMLLRHLTRLDEARTQFERVLEIDPEDPDAHYQFAVLIIDSNPEEARIHLEKTLERIPHHESACYRLQVLLRKSGEKERARELLLRFQALKSSGAGVFSGMKYGEMGRYAYVVRAFEEPPIQGDPRTPPAPPAYTDVAQQSGLVASAAGRAGWPGDSAREEVDFGPGAASADVDGDGDVDLYIPGLGRNGEGALYLNEAGQFSAAAKTGINGRGAIGAYFGDSDGDGDPDLYLTCAGPNRLYRNGGGTFVDATESSGTQGGDFLSIGAAWADADHDGDLDLYVANYSDAAGESPGAPNALWRNNGDGTFADVASEAGVDGANSATMSVLFFDVDDDRDLDLYLVNHRGRNQLFLNDRVGQYRDATSWFPALDDDGPGMGALLGDVDLNGREDVLLLKGAEPPRLLLQPERGQFVEDLDFASKVRDLGGVVSGLLGDLDLDGDLDVAFFGAGTGHQILMNIGRGRFDSAVAMGAAPEGREAREAPNARGAVGVDFNGDGSLELLVTRASGRPELWRAPAPEGRHWLEVIPSKGNGAAAEWIDPTAIGLFVELKTGRRLQAATIISSSGYLGNPPARAHFGLGEHGKVDYARLSWPDAVLQSELEVAADQRWRVTKAKRKPSSCPILFSWDGERFAFVTDFLGVGGVGFFITPQEYAPPDPTEDIRIPPALIKPQDGKLRLCIAEPLEEVAYLDELHLVAYDHPAAWELYPDERFTGTPPFPTGELFAVAEKIFPVRARNDRSEDVLNRILEVDRRYVRPPADPRFVGYAKDHWIELDFGGRLRDIAPDERLVLYLYGWVEYTYSHVNYAAYQAGLTMSSPRIEVPDGNGGWRVAMQEAGFPAGLPRMMTLDVSALPIRENGRFRIRTNMEVFWDQIFVGKDVAGPEIRAHTLRPTFARLRYLGYPREYSPDGSDPTLYDYKRVDQGLPFKNLTGDYTRYGDVRALLEVVDDRFVIMGRGEELAIEFDATELPTLSDGWSRTFVLHTDGYCKDMDLYTAYPDAVEPLPYHAMDNYPPAAPPAQSKGWDEYRRIWNTRRIEGGTD